VRLSDGQPTAWPLLRVDRYGPPAAGARDLGGAAGDPLAPVGILEPQSAALMRSADPDARLVRTEHTGSGRCSRRAWWFRARRDKGANMHGMGS
jgi:hypothetical protein